jgi:proton-dependent oligopeptide transporter, POT family
MISSTTNGDFLGHPKSLYICFATEMWERFSFYGMKFLLLLYLTKHHLFSDGEGLDVLGAYAGLAYALPVIGGLIADRYLGTVKSVLFGGILLSLGHLLMAVEGHQAVYYAANTVLSENLKLANGTVIAAGTQLTEAITMRDTAALDVFYLALTLIVVGVGFLKPNISVIVGKLYPVNDPRRDSGFTIFYMGINVGSFLATIFCSWLGETYGWKYGFGLAAFGMMFGLCTFMWGQKYLRPYAEIPNPALLKKKFVSVLTREHLIYLSVLPAIVVIWFLMQREPVVHVTQNIFLLIGIVGILGYSMLHKDTQKNRYVVIGLAAFTILIGTLAVLAQNGYLSLSSTFSEMTVYAMLLAIIGYIIYGYVFHFTIEFSRTLVLMILIVSTVVFWALFEQAAGSMTLFADRSLDRQFGSTTIVASQFSSLNAGFIMLLSIPFAFLWPWLEKRNLNPSTPVKFALGIIQAGLGFGALVIGAHYPNEAGKVAAIWMVLAYLLHSTGELCLSPIGLSAVTSLSIPKVVSVSMGTWFVATSLSETVAFRLSKLAAIDTKVGGSTPAEMLAGYTSLFDKLMWTGVIFGVFMLIISPLLKKAMCGIR